MENKVNDIRPTQQAELDEALYQACAKGTVEEVRALLEQGENPNAPHWETPWYDEDGMMRENDFCIPDSTDRYASLYFCNRKLTRRVPREVLEELKAKKG